MVLTQIFHNELCDMWFIRNGEVRVFQTFRAKVIDNKDPLNQNRVKVFIPELMKNIKGIWVRPSYNFNKVAVSPQVGDTVLVMFENGNLQNGVYIGHVRLSCPKDKNNLDCGSIEDKEQDIQNSPLDYWLLETPNLRRIRLSDSKNLIQLGSYTSKRILEIDDQNQIIKLESTNCNRIFHIDDKAKKIIIQTPNGTIEIDDNDPHIKATIGQSTVMLQPSKIIAKCGGSRIQMDTSKIMAQANLIMLN